MPLDSATASSSRRWYIEAALVHGSSAPSEIESVGSGTISSGSITRWKPSPWQRSHAPCGELNEKIRGSISGIEAPQLRQAKRSEKIWRSPDSASSISMRPSANCEAASIDSASRLRTPSFITRRSTTIEMSCLYFLSSSISSSSRRSSPSTTARA